jgi:hypothetical protein
MLPLLLALIRTFASSPITTACVAWLGRLVTRLLARQLQMPEALVHNTGLYVYASIDSIERRLLRTVLTSLARN